MLTSSIEQYRMLLSLLWYLLNGWRMWIEVILETTYIHARWMTQAIKQESCIHLDYCLTARRASTLLNEHLLDRHLTSSNP